ncbi:MAG: ABC transporter permease subunit [Myxococcota bacterium]
MTLPPQWFSMLLAELALIFRRSSGIGAMLVSVMIGVFTPLVLIWVQNNAGGAQINGAPVEGMVNFSAASSGGWALYVRHFFILPLLLLFATGGSLAGELDQHTLREVLVRPVPRWSVLLAKMFALMGLSTVCLVLTLIPSLGLGAALFGTADPMKDVLLGYLASVGADLGIITFGLLASTFVRSVAGVVVSVVLLLIFDYAARTLLWLREKMMGFIAESSGEELPEAVQYSQLLPGAALECWQGYTGDWTVEPFVGLAILVTVCLTAALVRFQRMDVP